ncbi:hypothetical protein K488DRAFT_48343, partial [Vararia minispora EC-137]
GLSGYLKVDNATYRWLGQSPAYNVTVTTLTVTNMILTPTRTIFTFNVGTQMQFNFTFLSPITPGDFVSYSIPFSYISIDAASLDGQAHSIQIYSDITGEWLSGSYAQTMTWRSASTSPNIIHSSSLLNPQVYTDISGQANWGTSYYATAAGPGVTYMINSDPNCRGLFQVAGKLNNSIMSDPPRLIEHDWPVLALSHDLGVISSTSSPIVIAIGFMRSPAVSLTDLSQVKQDRFLYYETMYSNSTTLVNDILANYTQVASAANALDASLMNAANDAVQGTGGALADLISLAARQTIANTELTVAKGKDGAWNTSDVMLFVREGDESYPRTQPVELLYASFPMFMTIDPSLGKPLLEPLFRLQSSSLYGFDYAAPDLSSTYPNITLANLAHEQSAVEQTGNMLIMSYAQALFSGDSSQVETYYGLLRSWADYLVDHAMALGDQMPTDPSPVLNETNLAIKGIIGVKAMSAIALNLNVSDDAARYSDAASNLYSRWKAGGALGSSNNFLASFNSQNSSSTGYNLFADKWLNLSVAEPAVYGGQQSLISGLLGSNTAAYGISTNSGSSTAVVVSWNMFVASLVSDLMVRSTLVSRLHSFVSSNKSGDIWPLVYNGSGNPMYGRGSVGAGSVFAPMALSIQRPSFSASAGFSPPSRISSNMGSRANVIAIAVVGGAAGFAVVGALVFVFFVVRRRRHRAGAHPEKQDGARRRPFVHLPSGGESRCELLTRLRVPDTNRPVSSKTLLHLQYTQSDSLLDVPRSEPPPPWSPGSGSEASGEVHAPGSREERESGDSAGLRAEMDVLRREVAQIRAAGLDLPPTYE